MSADDAPPAAPPVSHSGASSAGAAGLVPATHGQPVQQQQQQQQPPPASPAPALDPEQLQLQLQHQQQPAAEIQTMCDATARTTSWNAQDQMMQFPEWFCFLDPKRVLISGDNGCQKDCCFPNGDFANMIFATIKPPDVTSTDARLAAKYKATLFAARVKAQRVQYKHLFPVLKAFPTTAAATMDSWLNEAVDPPLAYAPTTVAQGLLTRMQFRWFAGCSQDQLEALRTSRAVHPSILPAVIKHTKDFHCHEINALHMKSDVVPLQKFALLAIGGKIVYHCNSGGAEEGQSRAKFEGLIYVTWPPAVGGAVMPCEENHPLNWDTHSAACENFYKHAVLGNHCAPWIEFVQKLEGEALKGSVLKAVQAMPINELQSRARGVINETLSNSTANGKRARQVEFDALPDYSTETGLVKAAAKLWRELFIETKFFDDRKEKKRKRLEEEAQKMAEVAAGSSSASAAADSQSLTTPGCSFQVIKGILEVFKVTTGKDLIKNCTDAQIHALHDKMMPLFSPPTKTSGLFKKGLAKVVMNDIETLFQWKL